MKTRLLASTIACIAVMLGISSCNHSTKDKWGALLEKYTESPVNQLIFVKCTGGSDAEVSLYLKDGKKWNLYGTEAGKIGRNGLGKTKEGDGMSPEGEFGVGKAFGILPNPGTTLEYIDVTSSTFACDDDCVYYNTIIDTASVHHDCKGEDMSTIKGYNYGFQILYNPENVRGLGSNIFFHCGNCPTAGCVAVSEEFCRKVLCNINDGAVVCIHEK